MTTPDQLAQPILKKLEELNINVPYFEHPAAETVKEWEPICKDKGIEGILTKTLFLKGKKGDLHLVAAAETSPVDLKAFGKDARFATPEVMEAALKVQKGSVSPFSLIYDDEKKVNVYVDAKLMESSQRILFHPGTNWRTIAVTKDDLSAYLQALGYEIKVTDMSAAPAAAAPAKAAKDNKPKKADKVEKKDEGETKLGVDAKKVEESFSEWYSQVITRSDMLDYYDVSGCYILRPWAFKIWKIVQDFFGNEINEMGVEDCYFPMFVSKAALEKEKDHVEGFAPEVAWVTKSGKHDLTEPIAVRPTSETVMYPAFARWVQSHRDLPIRLNQWCNVVRWEFSHPQPFIRTREFLWQEGHSAFVNKPEAEKEVFDILELYRRVYEEYLAVPIIKGKKSEKEKFAGGDFTTTVEAFIPVTGRGVQGATSHHLGQNFSKMFGIKFEDHKKGGHEYAYQNSWGLTTRTLGVMIMVHSDDRGLVMPPMVSPLQVVIIPCGLSAKATKEEKESLYDECEKLAGRLKTAGVRVKADLRHNYSPGWRFADWELKGVPLRLELGPKDLQKQQAMACRRDVGGKDNKTALPLAGIETIVTDLLKQIQSEMFARAKAERDSHVVKVTNWPDFTPTLNAKNMILAPICSDLAVEEAIKKKSGEESLVQVEDEKAPSMGAKCLCIPFDQPALEPGTKCIISGKPAEFWALFGRSY
uniref:proline--tRNA ligase n=2 Tax=Eutreptiella gymnastica TaxID=73025 RepID=A0A7S1I9I8_9EUGL|mmetsp:Transcript_140772/g.245220  ORF Transcript_140772/g.245220 Transcript_140772/m.245220 type:complete len:701 (+) Transcript_140772:123-2225(+)